MFSVNLDKSFLFVIPCPSVLHQPVLVGCRVSHLGISLVKSHSCCDSASLWLPCRKEVQHQRSSG